MEGRNAHKTYADMAASDGGPKCPHRIQLRRALAEACVWPQSKQPPDDEVKWNSCAPVTTLSSCPPAVLLVRHMHDEAAPQCYCGRVQEHRTPTHAQPSPSRAWIERTWIVPLPPLLAQTECLSPKRGRCHSPCTPIQPAMRCIGPAPTHDMLTRAPILPNKSHRCQRGAIAAFSTA